MRVAQETKFYSATKTYLRIRRRLRLMVKNVIAEEDRRKAFSQEFRPMIDKNQTLKFRVFWALLVIICIFIYLYQMYDRISYYLASPKGLDVTEIEMEEYLFPDIHTCVPLNKYVKDYYDLLGIAKITQITALNPLDELIPKKDVDLTKLWNLNYSYDVIRHVFLEPYHKKPILLNQTLTQELNPRGTCTRVSSGITMHNSEIYSTLGYEFKVPELVQGQSLTLIALTHPFDFQYGYALTSATNVKVGVKFKEHNLINTKNQPCAPFEKYIECGKRCTETILDKNPCWLPYRPRFTNGHRLELCNNSDATLKMCRQNMNDIMSPTPEVDCGCTRSCKIIHVHPSFQIEPSYNGISTKRLYLLDNHMTILKERLIYDFMNLLSDFGGNLGLWLGLSLLSLINLVLVIAQCYRAKPINHKHYVIRKIKANLLAAQTLKTETSKSNITPLQPLVYLCLFAFSGFTMQQRLQLYLSEPIQTIVSIEDPHNITFPNIIICAGPHSGRILFQKLKYLYQQNQTNTKCNVDMLDLVNWNGLTVNKLWTLAYLKPISLNLIKLINPFSADLYNDYMHTKLANPHGTCVKHSFGPVKYQLFTMFVEYIAEMSNPTCKPDFTYVYITPFEDPNFSTNFNSFLPSSMATSSLLTKVNMHYLNTKNNHCNQNLTDYYNCKSHCFEDKMKKKQLCSMPFAIKKDVPYCNSSSTAKTVRTLYYDIRTNTNVEKECLCNRPCKQPFYKINEFSLAPVIMDGTVVNFVFPSNKIETIAEEFKYSFVALVSDIGNTFSLTLSLSVLTAIHFLCNFATLLVKKLNM